MPSALTNEHLWRLIATKPALGALLEEASVPVDMFISLEGLMSYLRHVVSSRAVITTLNYNKDQLVKHKLVSKTLSTPMDLCNLGTKTLTKVSASFKNWVYKNISYLNSASITDGALLNPFCSIGVYRSAREPRCPTLRFYVEDSPGMHRYLSILRRKITCIRSTSPEPIFPLDFLVVPTIVEDKILLRIEVIVEIGNHCPALFYHIEDYLKIISTFHRSYVCACLRT